MQHFPTGVVVPPGHNEVPVQSIVGTVRQLFMAIRVGAEDKIKALSGSLKWQVGNLHTLGHPYTTRVLDILGKHGYIHIEWEQQTQLEQQLTDIPGIVRELEILYKKQK